MFADPQTITINAVAKNLVKIKFDSYGSEYLLRETTGEYRLTIRNTSRVSGGKTIYRHAVDFTQTVYGLAGAADVVRKVYTVLENEKSDTDVAVNAHALALMAWETASNITKLINMES